MSYEQIDPIFNTWAKRHGLQVLTEYKDYQVRAVHLPEVGKESAGISVDPLSNEQKTVVRVGILRKPRRNSQHDELPATLANLEEVLEQAYAKAMAWLGGKA